MPETQTFRPKHIAITLHEPLTGNLKEEYNKRNEIIKMLLEEQVKLQIPVITMYLIDMQLREEEFSESVDALTRLFESILEFVNQHQIRVSAFGKWYDLPGTLVEAVKKLITESAEYDKFFLNICLNYDGQEEIVDACKLVSIKIAGGKMEASSISKQTIKENLYSSYFIPVDLIIKNNPQQLCGLLLWDSAQSKIYFTGKAWNKFDKKEFHKAITFYENLLKKEQPETE